MGRDAHGKVHAMEEQFSSLLREYRIAAGLSQEALAHRANLSPAAISTLERSTRKAPQRQTLALLAEGLNLSSDDRRRLEAAAGKARSRGPRNATSKGASPNNLPYLLNSFLGREEALAELGVLLQTRRLVTLVGTGGVGKTRLAIQTARVCSQQQRFNDGVFLVDLSTVTDAAFIASSIAAVFEIAERPTRGLLEALATALRDKATLLILDNCEHLIEEAARVAEYVLQTCETVSILATSREALRIDGEVVVAVEPLDVGSNSGAPAVQVFLDRIRDSDGKFAVLGSTDLSHVQNICARLDGLPLALELAAARAHDLTLSAISMRLDERFELLDRGRRTASVRQQTMRGAIDWSYRLLGESEQQLLRRVAVFPGSFTSEAVVAVCEEDSTDVRDALAALISKSLVAVVEDKAGHQRYRMLETIRAYALAMLAEHGEQAQLSTRHARYYCDLSKSLNAQYRFEFPRSVVVSLEPEIDNLREALRWTFSEGDPKLAIELAAWSGIVFWHLALFSEGVRWCERAASLDVHAGPALAARLALSLSQNLFNLGNMQRSLEAANEAVALYERIKDAAQMSTALNYVSHCRYQLGEIAQARIDAGRSLKIARALEDDLLIGRALRMAAATSDPAIARENMHEALIRYRAAKQSSGLEVVLL